MKRIIVMVMSACIALTGYSQKNFKDLIGRWEIINEDSSASLEIIDSATIVLSYNGEKKKIIDCKIDFTKSPVWFDFSTVDTTSATVMIKSLIEIMSDNVIKWQLFIDEDRTDHFSSTKGELFYLRKAKPVISTAIVSN